MDVKLFFIGLLMLGLCAIARAWIRDRELMGGRVEPPGPWPPPPDGPYSTPISLYEPPQTPTLAPKRAINLED